MSTPTSQNQSTGAFKAACAACTHHRRRCSADCPYAPYFPAGMHARVFKNVNRLYRLNYILTSLQNVPQDTRRRAMKGIVAEANCRAAYPVHGMCTFINHLQQQIDLCQAELDTVRGILRDINKNDSAS